jgi:hypothetical protein
MWIGINKFESYLGCKTDKASYWIGSEVAEEGGEP